MTPPSISLIPSSSTTTVSPKPLKPPPVVQPQLPSLETKLFSRRNAVVWLSLIAPLTYPASALSFGISGPKEWLKDQKKKTAKYLLAPIDASRNILGSAYLLLTRTESDFGEKELEEVQSLLRSAARDCVPQERNSFVQFQSNTGVEDLFTGKVGGIGKEQGGLYIVRQRNNQSSVKDLVKSAVVQGKTVDSSLWHRRLGHASIKTMKHMSFLLDKILDVAINKDCSICPLAKQSRLLFPISHTVSNKPLELIHMDVWGPYRTPTHDRKHFFLTILDDHTRFTWVYLLQMKSDVATVLKMFLPLIKTQFSVVLKVVRTDNGTEFFNKVCTDLFNSYGIIHQSSCVYTSQQNGVAERKHRHILDIALALKFQAQIPTRY